MQILTLKEDAKYNKTVFHCNANPSREITYVSCQRIAFRFRETPSKCRQLCRYSHVYVLVLNDCFLRDFLRFSTLMGYWLGQ